MSRRLKDIAEKEAPRKFLTGCKAMGGMAPAMASKEQSKEKVI